MAIADLAKWCSFIWEWVLQAPYRLFFWMLPNDRMSHAPYWINPFSCLLVAEVFPQKYEDEGEMPALPPGFLIFGWLNPDHKAITSALRSTRLCAPGIHGKWVYWALRMSSSIGRVYELSNQFAWLPVRPAILCVRPFGQRLGVRSPESAFCFCSGSGVVSSLHRNHGSRWIADELEMDTGRACTCGELWTLFLSYVSPDWN